MRYYSESGGNVLCKFENCFKKDFYDITIRILLCYLLPSDSNVASVGWSIRMITIDDYTKDGGKEFLSRCTVFYLQIPNNSVGIRLKNAMHLGRKFLAAIFSAIVFSSFFPWKLQ